MRSSVRFLGASTLAGSSHPARRAALGLGLAALLLSGFGFASTTLLTGALSGAAESPPNGSPGTGSTTVTYDSVTHMLTVAVGFSGLQGNTTASHIHCCTANPNTLTAGVATQTPTFSGFPLGVTAGTYQNSFDLTQASAYNPAFVTANGGTAASAEAVLVAGMLANKSYLNIHTVLVPSGEIRSFLTPVTTFEIPRPIPVLQASVMAALALILFLAGARYLVRRRR